MAFSAEYKPLDGTEHPHPANHKKSNPTAADQQATVTLIVQRQSPEAGSGRTAALRAESHAIAAPLTRERFAATHGAAPDAMERAKAFAEANGLEVVESNPERRSVVVRGAVAALNRAFHVELHDYDSPLGVYRGHEGPISLPEGLDKDVETVIGLDDRPIPVHHFSTAPRQNAGDPPNTRSLTPQQVAELYRFPSGGGAKQTVGIFEMQVNGRGAGYTVSDLTRTMEAFGGDLKVIIPTDVSVDGVVNSGTSDGETGLDITVAGAVAQEAQIAVYFTGASAQNILHALQRMIHPGTNDPQPTILSISYSWGPDDPGGTGLSEQDFKQISSLFQDAAALQITVLVSSGDFGASLESETEAQTSYPATDPWVTACGGTTLGNIDGDPFDEFVWNDTGSAGPGATGGGVSARFGLPEYQLRAGIPKQIRTGQVGRGIPDIAGNASQNSGYIQVVNGRRDLVGGTSAVAPLYAGLIARINANLGFPAGFLNPVLYASSARICRPIVAPPGPVDNSFGRVVGYPAGPGWDACTGLGCVDGASLQAEIQASRSATLEFTEAKI